MEDRRMLDIACQLLSGVDWRLVQLSGAQPSSLAGTLNGFSLRASNDVWSDECAGPLDGNGNPSLTNTQRQSLWQAIRLTRLGDPDNAELALLRMFLRP